MGVEIVQIDDPHLCLFVDPDVRKKYDNPDRAADFAVDMINETVEGSSGIKFAVHLCRRAGARVRGEKHHAGTYGPILPSSTGLKVQHLTMEFTAAGADDLESLGRLREDFELGLGVVDVTPGAPEAAALIAARVERALTRIDKKRITLNPDCGFAPGSAAKGRYQQQRHDVDDLDQRVDGGAGGVLVGIAHGVAGDGGLVRVGTFAAEVAFLDVFLGVVPGAAAGGHRDRDEQAGDDGAHQHAAQRLRAHQAASRPGTGTTTGSSDGTIISLIAALVSMSTAGAVLRLARCLP